MDYLLKVDWPALFVPKLSLLEILIRGVAGRLRPRQRREEGAPAGARRSARPATNRAGGGRPRAGPAPVPGGRPARRGPDPLARGADEWSHRPGRGSERRPGPLGIPPE